MNCYDCGKQHMNNEETYTRAFINEHLSKYKSIWENKVLHETIQWFLYCIQRKVHNRYISLIKLFNLLTNHFKLQKTLNKQKNLCNYLQ